MIGRLPDNDGCCDNCDTYLNGLDGFDNHKYLWKWVKCRFKSSIAKDNIRLENGGI